MDDAGTETPLDEDEPGAQRHAILGTLLWMLACAIGGGVPALILWLALPGSRWEWVGETWLWVLNLGLTGFWWLWVGWRRDIIFRTRVQAYALGAIGGGFTIALCTGIGASVLGSDEPGIGLMLLPVTAPVGLGMLLPVLIFVGVLAHLIWDIRPARG